MIKPAILRPVLLLAAAALAGCASPAVVMVSRGYEPARVQRVTLAGFDDYPGLPGSGEAASSAFEKYLLLAGYRLVERRQVSALMNERDFSYANATVGQIQILGKTLGVDALVLGNIAEYSGSSEHTVMVDMPQQQIDPLYGQVITKSGGRGEPRVTTVQNVVSGYAVTQTHTVVPQTEVTPAHVALSARLVDVQTAEVLWSVSAASDGDSASAALEQASSRAMQAVVKKLKSLAAAAGKKP
ncbi:MAG: hypothetical protein ACHQ51_00390 [Elusimicrobiota bacterium]